MFNISPSQVRGLDPETILKYLQTDYTPLYNSMRDANAMRQFYDTQRHNEEKDARSLKFDREKEARLAENDVFTRNIAAQQEQRAADKYSRGKAPYDKAYLAGLFKTFSGEEPPQELINSLTSVSRDEAEGLMPGLSQYALNLRQQKTLTAKEKAQADAQSFKAEQSEKAGTRRATLQAQAEEAAMSRITARGQLGLSAQEHRQAFAKDRDILKADLQKQMQERKITAEEAADSLRIFTNTSLQLMKIAIDEKKLETDPTRQGTVVNVNLGDAQNKAADIMSKAPKQQGEMVGPKQPSFQENVEEIEEIISEGDTETMVKAVKRIQAKNYPPAIKEAMLKRLGEGLRYATSQGWKPSR